MSRIRTTSAFVLIALLAIALCGCSPHRLLISAVAHRDVGTVKLLLKGGADPNFKELGMTPLMTSAVIRSPEISQLLIDNGAEVNATNQFDETALHTAAMTGDCATIKVLILSGAVVDAADATGSTPLMGSIIGGKADAAKCLIDNGADVNRPARGGQTPLMHAAWSGDLATVQLLLDAGADPALKTDCGEIAEDIVAEKVSSGLKDEHTDEIQRLLQDRRSSKTPSASPLTKHPDGCTCSE